MEVITSHTNADFDTFASMVAAKKLYPEAHLVFSGSVEKRLKEALEEIALYPVERIRDIDLSKITRLILVDVRQAERTGPFAEVALRPGVEVHIYDHHPPTDRDLHGAVEVVEPYGSSTTVLTHILREKGVFLSPQEATVLMAGIYEDTGSLSFPSTTVKDYEAASFLLSSGADLSAVSGLIRRELTPYEVSLLNELLNSETVYTIGGIDIVIAEGALEKYSGDVSILAHKLRDIENMACLFVLVDTGDRVHVIARSSAPGADVGGILKGLGGGGHRSAASATLKDATLTQAKEKLVAAIREKIPPLRTAGDIMSHPPIVSSPELALKDAQTLMRRYNINAMPVVKKDNGILGVITRQVVDKALYHGLGNAPVADYMTTGCECVRLETSTDDIRDMVISRGQRLLPVLKGKKVAGVITRTDLLKLLQDEIRSRPSGEAAREYKKARHLTSVMKERIPQWLLGVLKGAGETADRLGFKAYAVGGFVRDLILRRDNLDVDIVIEGGDGIRFAEAFAKERGLKVRAHQRFRTAVLIFPDGYKMDVATARLEYYERPGSLPTVERSSLKLDLYRRDFIINTLALSLNPGRFGELVDFFGAQKDIKEKTVRVLHNLSFVEDPTRALRAVRFSEKFGFRIEKHTLNLIKNAVKLGLLSHTSGARVLDEIKNILEEESAPKSIRRLDEIGLLQLIHKGITWNMERERFFEAAREALIWHRLLYTGESAEGWLVLFLALTDPLKAEELSGLAQRLSISGRKSFSVIDARKDGLRALLRISSGMVKRNSALYALLKPIPLEVIIYLMAKAPEEDAKRALSLYITKLKKTQIYLKGNDLKKLGIKEGPAIGELLKRLFEKRLDGELSTREEEEGFVLRHIASYGAKAARRSAGVK